MAPCVIFFHSSLQPTPLEAETFSVRVFNCIVEVGVVGIHLRERERGGDGS